MNPCLPLPQLLLIMVEWRGLRNAHDSFRKKFRRKCTPRTKALSILHFWNALDAVMLATVLHFHIHESALAKLHLHSIEQSHPRHTHMPHHLRHSPTQSMTPTPTLTHTTQSLTTSLAPIAHVPRQPARYIDLRYRIRGLCTLSAQGQLAIFFV